MNLRQEYILLYKNNCFEWFFVRTLEQSFPLSSQLTSFLQFIHAIYVRYILSLTKQKLRPILSRKGLTFSVLRRENSLFVAEVLQVHFVNERPVQ